VPRRIAGPTHPRATTPRPCNDSPEPPPPLAPLVEMRGRPAAPAWGGGAAGVRPTGPAPPAGAPAGRGARPQGGPRWRFPEELAAVRAASHGGPSRGTRLPGFEPGRGRRRPGGRNPLPCLAFTYHRPSAPRVRRRKCQPATRPGETMPQGNELFLPKPLWGKGLGTFVSLTPSDTPADLRDGPTRATGSQEGRCGAPGLPSAGHKRLLLTTL